MVKYREILRQRAMGVSVRNIAFSCKCSTATVRTVIDRSKAKGLEWPLPEEMNDAAIRAVIYPKKSKADSLKVLNYKFRTRPNVTLFKLSMNAGAAMRPLPSYSPHHFSRLA